MRIAIAALILLALAGCRDKSVELPSGIEAELVGTVIEEQPDGEVWMILQVLAPDLGQSQITSVETAGDTAFLCDTWGVPAAAEQTETPDQIVVQIMSERIERGQPAPGVAQVFAGYRLEGESCIWEDF